MHTCNSLLCEPLTCNPSVFQSQSPVPLITPILERDHLRSIMNSTWKPDFHSQCLLIPQSLLSCKSIQQLMQNHSAKAFYPKTHPLSCAMGARRPSATHVFFITPVDLPIAECNSIHAECRPPDVDMIFTGYTTNQTPLVTLFDSGASTSFISLKLCTLLGLPVSFPQYKAVATALNESSPILGRVSLTMRWGPITTVMSAHVVETLLLYIDLIAGRDFLNTYHAVLDYDRGQCAMRSDGGNTTALRADSIQSRQRTQPTHSRYDGGNTTGSEVPTLSTQPTTHSPPVGHCTPYYDSDNSPSISMVEARRYIKSGSKTYLVMVQVTEPKLPDMSSVPSEYRDDLKRLLIDCSSLFADDLPPGLPPNWCPCEVIPTDPNIKPPYRRPFRMSPLEKASMDKAIERLIRLHHIEPSTSPFGCPTFFVEKPNSPGELRHVFDYKALNALTHKNKFPIPRIDDLLNSFRGASVFSSFDLTIGYNQLRLVDSDVPKTAFTVCGGHWQYRVLPMGLSNSGSVFQKAMQNIFDTHTRTRASNGFTPANGYSATPPTILVYLDDICLVSSSHSEHLLHLKELMEVMQSKGLICKLRKCHFFQSELRYLGHIISAEGIRADPRKVQALLDWPFPTTAKEMQQFLGLANYFSKSTPDYSRVVAPLHDLTQKGISYASLASHPIYRFTFDRIKTIMSHPPCLAIPDPELPYELISDASMTGCGAILVQNNRPVAYFSSKYSKAERNYSTGEQELLGVVKALKEWRCYLEGCSGGMTVITDHNPLTYFPTQIVVSRRQSRWIDLIARFNMIWKHTPGKDNPADGLSRLHVATLFALNTCSPIHQSSQWIAPQPHCSDLHYCCSLSTVLTLNKNFITLFPQAYITDPHFSDSQYTQHFTLSAGFWYDRDHRIVVPASLRHLVMEAHHSTAHSGHFGTRRTTDLISRSFYWPGMHSNIKAFCQACPSCQTSKSSTQRPFGLLQPLNVPDERWEVVCLDWITGLPRTRTGNDSILVFIDKLTKMVHLAPCKKTITSKQAAQLFLTHVWCKHGSPIRLVSDRDPRFTSDFWKQFCSHLGMQQSMSTAYHPESDAQTERSNRTIEEVLRNFCPSSTAWDDLLPFVEFAMNNAKNASTNETPFMLNTGKHPRNPISSQLPPRPPGSHVLPSIEEAFKNRDDVLLRVRKLLLSAQDRQKTYADKGRRSHTFELGQYVLLSSKNFRFEGKGKRKLYPKFVGPFQIDRMCGPNAAMLSLPPDWTIHNVFHVSLLRPYVNPPTGVLLSHIPPAAPDGKPTARVESILAHKDIKLGKRSVREYLVKWAGLSSEHNSWESASYLDPDHIRIYTRWVLDQRGGSVGM